MPFKTSTPPPPKKNNYNLEAIQIFNKEQDHAPIACQFFSVYSVLKINRIL